MKILQSAQRDLAVLGLGPRQFAQKFPLNGINAYAFFILFSMLNSASLFLLIEAKTFQELTYSVYAISSIILVLVVYVLAWWKLDQFYTLVKHVERIIDQSRFDRRKKLFISEFIMYSMQG